jgi:hypothetical protein
MSSLLADRGFVKTGSCPCGGDLKETWVLLGRPNVASIYVEVRPNRDAFRVTSVYPPIRGTLAEMGRKIDEIIRGVRAG